MERNCNECFHYDACLGVDTEDIMNDGYHAQYCSNYLHKGFVMVSISEERWNEAYKYLNMMIIEYTLTGMAGVFGLQLSLLALKRRYDNGERTPKLYEEIMACE